MLIRSNDILLKKTEYATKIDIEYDINRHHMSANSKHFRFNNEGTLPLFLKMFNDVPEYVDGEKIHLIKKHEINRLDLISHKYYGTPELLWVIAAVNNIDPLEMEEGIIIRILPKEYIEYNLLRYNIV